MPETSAPVSSSRREVSFAQPAADYPEDLEDILDLSSSSDESDTGFGTFSASQSSLQRQETEAQGPKKPTYLEYIDYKALLASLRTLDQHDTARHLMTVAALKRLPPSEYAAISSRTLRKGWTAWPLSPEQTSHAAPMDAAMPGVLHEEVTALLHRIMTRRLRREGREVSADELDEAVSGPVTETIVDRVTTLLRGLATLRASQGGTKASTLARMELLTHVDLLTVARHASSLSASGLSAVEERGRALFGASESAPRLGAVSAHEERKPMAEVSEEVHTGAGRWDLRGTKRRRVIADDETLDDEAKRYFKMKVSTDAGRRFDATTRLVPASLVKREPT